VIKKPSELFNADILERWKDPSYTGEELIVKVNFEKIFIGCQA